MSVYNYKELAAHVGHNIECASYADGENVAVECMDCHVVLLDYNKDDSDDGQGRSREPRWCYSNECEHIDCHRCNPVQGCTFHDKCQEEDRF